MKFQKIIGLSKEALKKISFMNKLLIQYNKVAYCLELGVANALLLMICITYLGSSSLIFFGFSIRILVISPLIIFQLINLLKLC